MKEKEETGEMKKIQIGDVITFKAQTRWSYRKAARKVTGFYLGQPTVTYDGCPGFIVRTNEIISVDDSRPEYRMPHL